MAFIKQLTPLVVLVAVVPSTVPSTVGVDALRIMQVPEAPAIMPEEATSVTGAEKGHLFNPIADRSEIPAWHLHVIATDWFARKKSNGSASFNVLPTYWSGGAAAHNVIEISTAAHNVLNATSLTVKFPIQINHPRTNKTVAKIEYSPEKRDHVEISCNDGRGKDLSFVERYDDVLTIHNGYIADKVVAPGNIDTIFDVAFIRLPGACAKNAEEREFVSIPLVAPKDVEAQRKDLAEIPGLEAKLECKTTDSMVFNNRKKNRRWRALKSAGGIKKLTKGECGRFHCYLPDIAATPSVGQPEPKLIHINKKLSLPGYSGGALACRYQLAESSGENLSDDQLSRLPDEITSKIGKWFQIGHVRSGGFITSTSKFGDSQFVVTKPLYEELIGSHESQKTAISLDRFDVTRWTQSKAVRKRANKKAAKKARRGAQESESKKSNVPEQRSPKTVLFPAVRRTIIHELSSVLSSENFDNVDDVKLQNAFRQFRKLSTHPDGLDARKASFALLREIETI